MKDFQVEKLRKEVKAQPLDLVAMIMANNPNAVALSFRGISGESVNADDFDGMMETLEYLVQSDPANAHNTIMGILNVPIVEPALTPVGRSFVLDELIDSEQRQLRSGIFDTTIPELNEEIANTPPASSTATGQGNSFNWGPIIQNALPGILAAFGITQPQNPNSNLPSPGANEPTVNWLLIIFVIVIVAIIGLLIYRASK